MPTAVDHIPITSDYAEIARRPLDPEQCALVVIDIQEKLLPPIFQKDQLVRNAQLLIRAAGILKIPALVSTQYAKGLGGTVPEVASLLTGTEPVDKTLFSCFGSDAFCSQTPARPAHNAVALRHGEPHLRDSDRAGRSSRRISRPRRVRRGQFAHRMELEDRSGSHAGGWSSHFFDGNDHLRTNAVVLVGSVQRPVAAPEGLAFRKTKRTQKAEGSNQ
jgi:hypothetical protein